MVKSQKKTNKQENAFLASYYFSDLPDMEDGKKLPS